MKQKLLSLLLSATLVCNVGILSTLAADGQPAATEGQPLANEQQPAALTIGSSQETACPECGGLNGIHLEGCPQYVAPAPQETAITGWQWVDPEGMLIDGALALPGASEETPALFADIEALLPAAITIQAEDSEESSQIELAGWGCEGYPEEGAYEGSYVFTAQLPEGYVLAEGAPALTVPVKPGGAELMANTGTIDMSQTNKVFANGIPIVIKENGSKTSVYDEEENLLSGDTDVSNYTIYGGWNDSNTHSGNTSVTLESGTVNDIWGGSSGSGMLEGNTSVILKAGTVNGSVYGGGNGGDVTGTANVTLNGSAQVKANIFGGGYNGDAANTKVVCNGGTAMTVYGGGRSGDVTGTANVTVNDGAQVTTAVYGGGENGDVKEAQIILAAGFASYATIYAGGYSDSGEVLTDSSEIILPSEGDIPYTEFNGSTAQQSTIRVKQNAAGSSGQPAANRNVWFVGIQHIIVEDGLAVLTGSADELTGSADELNLLSLTVLENATVRFQNWQTIGIEQLSGTGCIAFPNPSSFTSSGSDSQHTPVSVTHIADGTRLMLKPEGTWQNIKDYVFFQGAAIDALSSPDCFYATQYRVSLKAIRGGGQGIYLEDLPSYTVSVSASPSKGGSVTGGGSYWQGTQVSLQATPNDGWRFLRWEENGQSVSTQAAYTFTADKNRTLTAVFEGEQIRLEALTKVPEELKNTFNTVEEISYELLRKVTTQAGYTEENFIVIDVQLLVSRDGGNNWEPATEEDFPAEGLTVTLPYPQGTGRDTHDFAVTHMFTLTSARLRTTAGDIEQPPVEKTEAGLRVTFHGLSPVGIAWKETVREEPGIISTGSGSDDSPEQETDDEYSFWQQVKRQIEGAKADAVIRVNAHSYQRMPLSVMKALRSREDVSLVIRWDGGKPITIPAGKALWEERRAYYPLSYLEGYDFGLPAAGDTASPDKANPGTGAPERFPLCGEKR